MTPLAIALTNLVEKILGGPIVEDSLELHRLPEVHAELEHVFTLLGDEHPIQQVWELRSWIAEWFDAHGEEYVTAPPLEFWDRTVEALLNPVRPFVFSTVAALGVFPAEALTLGQSGLSLEPERESGVYVHTLRGAVSAPTTAGARVKLEHTLEEFLGALSLLGFVGVLQGPAPPSELGLSLAQLDGVPFQHSEGTTRLVARAQFVKQFKPFSLCGKHRVDVLLDRLFGKSSDSESLRYAMRRRIRAVMTEDYGESVTIHLGLLDGVLPSQHAHSLSAEDWTGEVASGLANLGLQDVDPLALEKLYAARASFQQYGRVREEPQLKSYATGLSAALLRVLLQNLAD